MDRKEEYHDPDYPETSAGAAEVAPGTSEDDKIEKIKRIVSREFSAELGARENEIMLIDQRSMTARRMLQRLRYIIVNNYYMKESLKMTQGQLQDEVAGQVEPRARGVVTSILRDPQRRLHPSVRKLLGKQSTPVDLHEILFRRCAPRNKSKKDYQAMVQSRNYTVAADTTKSLRPSDPPEVDELPSRPKKIPRRLDPKITNVLTLDEATRNQMKHRYRIIIGNTSKFSPAASGRDRSTHQWLLYVRGPAAAPDLAGVLTGVTVRLHHSYAPHHTVHLDKPPFHVSRRGWGEFPARVQLHFPLPHRNRPAALHHTIALDRSYSGQQTLGSETVVDVWLYSTEEMLKKEFKEDESETIKTEPVDPEPQTELTQEMVTLEPQNIHENIFANTETDKQTDSWLDFFSNTTELDVDEMIIKPTKKTDDKNDLESMIESNVISKENEQNDLEPVIKQEVIDEETKEYTEPYDIKKQIEDIPNELLSQTNSPKKRIMKYMDPTTGKIYYLEMDRKLDLTKVQEIVINSKGNIKTAKISPIKPNGLKNVRKPTKKGGISLLKPEIKSLLKNESSKTENKVSKLINNFTHIENDHCYLGPVPYKEPLHSSLSTLTEIINEDNIKVKKERTVYECICEVLSRFTSVRVAVDYCLKKMPLVNSEARDPDFLKYFPFVVETEEKYWKLDFAKRRNIEWTRSKLINKLLTEHLHTTETIWRTKQILIYSRLHGYFPVRPDALEPPTINQSIWSSWTDINSYKETDIKEMYPNAASICSLTKFNSDEFSQNLSESLDISDSDEEIEIVDVHTEKKVKKEVLPDSSSELTVLPVQDPQQRLRFLFLERKCADIGIELRNEDVGNGYSYSAVHAVLLSAMKSFAEEVIRGALAQRLAAERRDRALPPVWMGSSSSLSVVRLGDASRALHAPRLLAVTLRDLRHHHHHNNNHNDNNDDTQHL